MPAGDPGVEDVHDRSVYDLVVAATDKLPLPLPADSYFDEVLSGMKGAASSLTAPGSLNAPGGSRKAFAVGESKAPPQARELWLRLRRVLHSDPTRKFFVSVAWLAMGALFGSIHDDAAAQLRSALAKSWFLMTLQVGQMVPDADGRDWLLSVLPVVFAQAIYRFMVDSFKADNAVLIQTAGPLLDKLMHFVHGEIAGFQMSKQTGHKMRRELFQPVVIALPHMNFIETAKSQERQAKLENQSVNKPLTFGEAGGQPIDLLQLEHILSQRDLDRTEEQRLPSKSTRRKTAQVIQELGVVRYANLVEEGNDLLSRQLCRLNGGKANSDAGETEFSIECDSELSPAAKSPLSQEAHQAALLSTLGASQPSSPQREKTTVAKARQDAEREQRKRQKALALKISDPLPESMCQQGPFTTTFVSPLVDRLAPSERNRDALRKSASEARRLVMGPAKFGLLPPIKASKDGLATSASAPSLLSACDAVNTAAVYVGASASEEHCQKRKARKMENQVKAEIKANLEIAAPTATRQVRRVQRPDVKLSLLPTRVKPSDVVQRLDHHIQAVRKKTFNEYKKEYDISTGLKKNYVDPGVLSSEEAALSKRLLELGSDKPSLRMPGLGAQFGARATKYMR